ncbi:hypothetical protein D9M71_492300 [compost metagenome]
MSYSCLINVAAWLRSIPVALLISLTVAITFCSCCEGATPSATPALIAMSRVIFWYCALICVGNTSARPTVTA